MIVLCFHRPFLTRRLKAVLWYFLQQLCSFLRLVWVLDKTFLYKLVKGLLRAHYPESRNKALMRWYRRVCYFGTFLAGEQGGIGRCFFASEWGGIRGSITQEPMRGIGSISLPSVHHLCRNLVDKTRFEIKGNLKQFKEFSVAKHN